MTPADIIALGQSRYSEPRLEPTRMAPEAADYFPPGAPRSSWLVGCQPLKSILTLATTVATKLRKASAYLT